MDSCEICGAVDDIQMWDDEPTTVYVCNRGKCAQELQRMVRDDYDAEFEREQWELRERYYGC
jgi:hypothetical protein